MMKNFDESIEINCNPVLLYIFDHSYRILIISGSRIGKTNILLILIKHKQPHVDKHIYKLKILLS